MAALVVAVPLALVGALFAAAALEARSPVMVVDAHGFRYRDGRSWTGVPWSGVLAVTVTRHRRPWQDGQVDVDLTGDERVSTRVGLSTPVATDVVERLRLLSAGRAQVQEVLPAVRESRTSATTAPRDPSTPSSAHDPVTAADQVAESADRPSTDEVYDQERDPAPIHRSDESDQSDEAADEQPFVRPAARLVASAGLARRAIRANLTRHAPPTVGSSALHADEHAHAPAQRLVLPEALHLDPRTDHPGLFLHPAPEPVALEPIEGPPPVVWTPEVPQVAVVGQQVRAARERLGLSVESIAERTRIRPHVLEGIEIDDFEPCGGDFYARGHLRNVARVLGIDPDRLVADYDEHYAQAPVGARRVFEAELAAGPRRSIRLTTGGPNWGALLGVVMVVAIVWGLGHLLTDRGEAAGEVTIPSPTAAASQPAVDPTSVAGLGAPTTNQLILRGRGESTRVVVRDGDDEVVWSGRLADGDSTRVRLVGRGTVTASDGGVIAARVNDNSLGRLGDPGERVERAIGRR